MSHIVKVNKINTNIIVLTLRYIVGILFLYFYFQKQINEKLRIVGINNKNDFNIDKSYLYQSIV